VFGLTDYSLIALVKYGGLVVETFILWTVMSALLGAIQRRP
jgi:hypothetical protein